MSYILAYDLGTGGTKASLFNEKGQAQSSAFVSCKTYYPQENFREQRPDDWWQMVVDSTKALLDKVHVEVSDIKAIGVSGHSLGVVPVDQQGSLLVGQVPIWSDARADAQVKDFFTRVDEEQWYMTTGNGFPAQLYAIFKIMWYKQHMKDVYDRTYAFIGTKDYVNLKLTGVIGTDHSYASGSGVYNLIEGRYEQSYIEASGVSKDRLPGLYGSDEVIGTLLPEMAKELGLSEATMVVSGGVDNACMALGAGCIDDGMSYTNLGTSAWVAIADHKPVVEADKRPYVFAHCIKGMYVSATAIFSAGNSYRWVRDQICEDLKNQEEQTGINAYDAMNALASEVPVGSNKLIFNPSLAGGSSLDKSENIRGGYIGLMLGHTRADMIRAALEGITMNLRLALDVLGDQVPLSHKMLIVGGGANSPLWMQMFADIYGMTVLKTVVGQEAGSLGAAALALVGAGIWDDYNAIGALHQLESAYEPDMNRKENYNQLLNIFSAVAEMQSDIGDLLAGVNVLED